MRDAKTGRRRGLRLALQIVGFLAGVASVVWCISIALKPENQEQWRRLWEAPASMIALVLGLSLAALVCEGTSFWLMLRPVKRLRWIDVQATNALATFLAYLPFKISAVTRVLIHNRRDGVPLPTIAAWFGNFGSMMLAVFGAALLLLATMREATWVWGAAVGAAGVAIAVGYWLLGSFFKGERGIERLARFVRRLPAGARLERGVRSSVWRGLHAGFDMYASLPNNLMGVGVRLLHGAIVTGRFLAVSAIVGVPISLEFAVPMGLVFFAIGATNPVGTLGSGREVAVGGVAALLLKASGQEASAASAFVPVALLVSATEAAVFMVMGVVGALWLRPDRLLKLRRQGELAGAQMWDEASAQQSAQQKERP